MNQPSNFFLRLKEFNQEQKKKIVKNILIGFNPLVGEFLSILIENKISKNLIDIIDKFLSLSKKEGLC